MQAEECLRAGDLDEALAKLQDEVRANPSKAELRIFLFQLLSVFGQWDRAMTQLNVAADMDADANLMAQMYRTALNCEVLRGQVFAGERSPLVFGEPSEWVGWLIQALSLLARGNGEAAAELRSRAFEAAAAIPGSINDKPFAWIADADPRLGPVLEAIIEGKYYWVPFERIGEVVVDEPTDLRDAVWAPAHFTWTNGGQAVGLIPTRYPGSENSADSSLRLARKTEWADLGNDYFAGCGQRMFATDADEVPLLEARHIVIEHASQESEGESTGNG